VIRRPRPWRGRISDEPENVGSRTGYGSLLAVTPTLAVFAMLAIPPVQGDAQQLSPIVSASFDFMPGATVADPTPGTFEENLETRIANPRFSLSIPVSIADGRAVLVTGLTYSLLDFRHRGADLPDLLPDRLHEVSYRIAVSAAVDEHTRVDFFAQPMLATDFENVNGDHFQFEGGVVFSRRSPASRTVVGFGAMVGNDFGGRLPLPVLTVNWRGASARLDLDLPRQAALFLMPGGFAEVGLYAIVEGNRYRRGDDATAIARYEPYISYSVITAGPALQLNVGRGMLLRLNGGAAVARRFEVDFEKPAVVFGGIAVAPRDRDLDLEPGAYLRATFEVRPP
jgi:hypothetical protein